MKILHTADWHIGAKWGIVDRTEDLLERAVPDIVNLAINEKVDMLLVAGDIFERQTNDSVQSAAEILREPFRELLDAHIDIVLLLGNHDSPPLFKFLRSAIQLVEGDKANRGRLHILNSAWVTTCKNLQIIHLPYMRPEHAAKTLQENFADLPDTVEMANWTIGRKLDQIAHKLRERIDHRLPALMAYHGTVQGTTIGTNEKTYEITYHQDFMLSPDSLLFNDQVPQYNALGHIHQYQELSRAVPTRYAGSIDRLDRGEREYEPSVILVELPENGRRAICERHKLPRPTPFLDENVSNQADLIALQDRLGAEKCSLALGHITLNCEPDQAYMLDQAVRDTFPRLQGVKNAVQRPRNVTHDKEMTAISDIKALANPPQTIRSYIAEKMPANEREGLLHALDVVEEALGHDH